MAELSIVPGKTRVGWIGTGVMGSSMVGHLMNAGFPATVYNRSKSKAEGLLSAGASWADSPKKVAENSDVIFSIVGFPSDVREVLLGSEGALAGSQAGKVLVDMTTSDPSLAVEISQAAQAKGVHSLDAPVSGGDVGAKNAALSIMVGGDKSVFEALMPCWQAMGKTIVYQGGGRRRAAYQGGQSGLDRHQYDRGLRSAVVRLQGRSGSPDSAAVRGERCGGELVAQ